MKVTVVRKENYRIDEIPKDVVLENTAEQIPIVGDVIKVGHTLNDFQALRVVDRVFRSKTGHGDEDTAFHEVILLVSELE